MDKMQICKVLSDLIAVSDQPLTVNGEIYKQRRGTVNLDEDAREGILELMAKVWCRNVGYGSYACYEQTKSGIDVDGCLVGEINRLNNDGIQTIGCCCGHGRAVGYIQVDPVSIDKMLKRGYVPLQIDKDGNGCWCFIPKTSLPPAAPEQEGAQDERD